MSWSFSAFESLYAVPSRNGIYKSSEHHGNGAKIVNMGELFAHEFVGPQDMSRLAMSEAELEKAGLVDGDLLFGRRSLVESGAGKCSVVEGLVEPTTFESSLIRVRLDLEKALPRFYYYWFRSRLGRGSIRAIVSGTNVKGIRGSELKNVLVPILGLDAQRRISGVLSAYDNFIENNRRRITLLEESARLLYREWFVHLRFPGHEHVKVVDGVPEGWGIRTIADMFFTTSGGTPSRANPEYFDGAINWVKTQELDDLFIFDTEEHISESAVKNSAAKIFPAGTLLVSIYGGTNIGRTGLLTVPSASNQACVALMPKQNRNDVYFAQKWLQENKDYLVGLGQGAAQTNISQQTLRSQAMLVPDIELLSEFTGHVEQVYQQIANFCMQNSKLREARDLLLPRLMSGEIQV